MTDNAEPINDHLDKDKASVFKEESNIMTLE